MKINKYILSLCLVCTIGLQGCEDFLDTYPKESYSDNTVWASQGTVDAFVVNCYGSAYDPYLNFSTWDKTFTNNMVNCRHSCPNEARGLMENTYGWGLNDRFAAIRNCNLILEKVDKSEVLNEAFKKRYTAEAKMMRAMIYYDLARKGGRYIWVDKVLNTEDEFNLPLTKDIVESYSYVLKDLREAIVNLPVEKVAGRLNKNAGLALLSEVCLTAAAYTDDAKALQTGSKSLYQEAVDAVDAIEDVSLDKDYESMFNQNGAYSSPEIILARYWSADNTQMMHTDMINLVPNLTNSNLEINGCSPLFNKPDIFECWLDHTPSQNLVDAYLVIDEESQKAVRWYESSQFKNNTKPIGADETMKKIEYKDEAELKGDRFKAFETTTPGKSISDLMYNRRDKRFDASIIHDGSWFLNEDITTCNHGNMSRWATKRYAADHVPLTNYSTRKYIYTDMAPRPFYNVYTDYHKILFRYGRALLNKAEALLKLGQIKEAVTTLNKTRTTHGGLPESTASTAEEAWNDYKIERRVELFWEGDFYFSLLRWGKYGKEANDGKEPGSVIDELCEPATFIEINKDRTAAFVGIVQQQNDQRKFDIRSYLFPITKSVIQANSAISDADQNKGWE
ncbi:RagB/SusD family nutrient uptake outer membrane protein [Bacteroides heparinolyticus]|uniref:RagB/SusD family nutrient uptake outer membrane protein n=1 Tax=Prevotella heparinolytica TaxID=28113 RepID=UPI003FA1079B